MVPPIHCAYPPPSNGATHPFFPSTDEITDGQRITDAATHDVERCKRAYRVLRDYRVLFGRALFWLPHCC